MVRNLTRIMLGEVFSLNFHTGRVRLKYIPRAIIRGKLQKSKRKCDRDV